MIGAIIGDITGSVREFALSKLRRRNRVVLLPEDGFFTDDTVMTCSGPYRRPGKGSGRRS